MIVLAGMSLSSQVSVRTRISGRTRSMIVCRSATLSLFLREQQLMLTSLSGFRDIFFLFFLRVAELRGVGRIGEEVPCGGPGSSKVGSSALRSERAEKLLNVLTLNMLVVRLGEPHLLQNHFSLGAATCSA